MAQGNKPPRVVLASSEERVEMVKENWERAKEISPEEKARVAALNETWKGVEGSKEAPLPTLKVKRIHSQAKLPAYANEGDIGLDLYAVDTWGLALLENQPVRVRTGICVEIPEGFYGRVAPRSGLGSKGVQVLGGVIDPSYRGEVMVVLVNCGKEWVEVRDGMKIAQLILERASRCEVAEVGEGEELSRSNRGSRGFGSSGE